MAATEDSSQPLKYKTISLKVSIHCEGCRKKVKKVLQNIEGVYTTTVDSQLNKVTVTGNVDAETLIKKLAKTGKPAEIWPEKVEKKEKEKKPAKSGGKTGDKEKTGDKKPAESSGEIQPDGESREEKPTAGKNTGGDGQNKESKSDVKKPKDSVSGDVSPSESDNKSNETGGGSGDKKKKKKGQKGDNNNNNNGAISNNDGDVEIPSNTNPDTPIPGGTNPDAPRTGTDPPATPQVAQRPSYQQVLHHYHPQPIYGMSYNTAYPSTSYGGAYHPSPAHPSMSYGDSYNPTQTSTQTHPSMSYNGPYYPTQQHPPPYTFPGSYPPPSPAANSYDMFSEENPNGCAVM